MWILTTEFQSFISIVQGVSQPVEYISKLVNQLQNIEITHKQLGQVCVSPIKLHEITITEAGQT